MNLCRLLRHWDPPSDLLLTVLHDFKRWALLPKDDVMDHR